MRKLGILFIALALTLGSVSVSMADTVTQKLGDTGITAEIKAKLAKDVRFGTLTEVEVNVTDGVVSLSGKVKNGDEKRSIEKIARDVDGVKMVKNDLRVVS